MFKILSPDSNLELSPTNFMNLADLPFIKRLIRTSSQTNLSCGELSRLDPLFCWVGPEPYLTLPCGLQAFLESGFVV